MNAEVSNAIHAVLAELTAMDRSALAQRWQAVFGCPAPRNSQAPLLRGALAWQAQMAHRAKTQSGDVGQLMRRVQREVAASPARASLTPGTRLVREWQGQTHHVTVTDGGFEYRGNHYRSLTAIARQITGTAWSGPLFFGLRS